MASDALKTRQASKDFPSAYGGPAIARLSEDVASTSVLSATHMPLSLSNISLYRDDSVRLLLSLSEHLELHSMFRCIPWATQLGSNVCTKQTHELSAPRAPVCCSLGLQELGSPHLYMTSTSFAPELCEFPEA